MDPFSWPTATPRPSSFRRANPDGSADLPEPYKPKYLKHSPQAGQLTREQALKVIEDYFNKLETEILDVINNQLNTKMKMNTITKTALSEKEALLNKLNTMSKKVNMALAKTRGPIKANSFFTANGILIEFGDDVKELADIQVGTKATIEGKPAEGEYTLPDGKKLTFEKGKLTDIKGELKNRAPFKAKRKPTGKRIPFHKPSK